MLRLYLCMGDEPETGGTIAPYPSRPFTISGHQVAIIGGKAFCAACKSTGIIAKAGGPRRHKHGDNEVALDGDILLCKCPRPPRMLATKQSTARHEDMGGGNGKYASAQDIEPVPCALFYDEQIHATGKGATDGYPFLIETADGRTVCGRIDSSGRLPRIYTDTAATYTIHWGDEALAHEEWQ
ncbi:PAAR domain-containing protein [Paraburkholderia adhaesiva]|uniref:PAAR domain-containing protein n=1 Tax=Paraburkholderia adhaesiva TaxID=2883244 RepID=UPI001F24BE68|nr:PAAR domain-containing protein [Paraburkholderia adhaesiva]